MGSIELRWDLFGVERCVCPLDGTISISSRVFICWSCISQRVEPYILLLITTIEFREITCTPLLTKLPSIAATILRGASQSEWPAQKEVLEWMNPIWGWFWKHFATRLIVYRNSVVIYHCMLIPWNQLSRRGVNSKIENTISELRSLEPSHPREK